MADTILDETIAALEQVRAAWLRVIQWDNQCAGTGKPCHSRKCGCALEMQNAIDSEPLTTPAHV